MEIEIFSVSATLWGDNQGNTYSKERFVTEEDALKAAQSNKDCTRCIDCVRCTGCTACTDCTGCKRCSGCTSCAKCADCTSCHSCSACLDCKNCNKCGNCRECSSCRECQSDRGCVKCTLCYGCVGCRNCTGCTDCIALRQSVYADAVGYTASHTCPQCGGTHEKTIYVSGHITPGYVALADAAKDNDYELLPWQPAVSTPFLGAHLPYTALRLTEELIVSRDGTDIGRFDISQRLIEVPAGDYRYVVSAVVTLPCGGYANLFSTVPVELMSSSGEGTEPSPLYRHVKAGLPGTACMDLWEKVQKFLYWAVL